LATPGTLAILLATVGCADGTPSVDSTTSEATVHGVVKYKGTPLDGGEIRFDPSNVKRRDAKVVIGPIGKDGSYKVTTLQGANMVRFNLPPELLKKDNNLQTAEKEYNVPSGDSTFDVELTP